MIPALIIFDAVFYFSFIIKVIAMKPFPFILWLNSEYFEYKQKNLHDLKKRFLQHFWAKSKRSRDRDMFLYYVFIFIFVNVLLILKEFCSSKPPVPESTNPNTYMDNTLAVYVN